MYIFEFIYIYIINNIHIYIYIHTHTLIEQHTKLGSNISCVVSLKPLTVNHVSGLYNGLQ